MRVHRRAAQPTRCKAKTPTSIGSLVHRQNSGEGSGASSSIACANASARSYVLISFVGPSWIKVDAAVLGEVVGELGPALFGDMA